jgi:hypothetical protein
VQKRAIFLGDRAYEPSGFRSIISPLDPICSHCLCHDPAGPLSYRPYFGPPRRPSWLGQVHNCNFRFFSRYCLTRCGDDSGREPCHRPLKPKKETVIAVISGLTFALILIVAGYQLYVIGQVDTSPITSIGQLGLTLTLGSTFGINLGEAIKKDEHVPGKLAFLSSFFGTLFLIMIGYGGYSIYRNEISTGLFTIVNLGLTGVAFTAIMHTHLIQPTGIKHLKQLIDLFSNRASPAILSGYATATVSGVGIGVSVGGSVAILTTLPSIWRWWKIRSKEIEVIDEEEPRRPIREI